MGPGGLKVTVPSMNRKTAVRQMAAIVILPLAMLQPAFGQGLFSAKGPMPLKLSAAPTLFLQCSRSAPVPVGKPWLPSAAEVAQLQKALPTHLTSSGQLARLNPKGEYRGQFAGFSQAGEKKIYAAYISSLSPLVPTGNPDGEAERWCDGWHNSWGIVYVPRTGKFEQFEVNGSL